MNKTFNRKIVEGSLKIVSETGKFKNPIQMNNINNLL